MAGGNTAFRIHGPAVVCFSGGRTSAYMLRRILDAWPDGLPGDVFVCFQNTGVEREETLTFIHEVEQRWSVPIVWQEYRRTFDPAHWEPGNPRALDVEAAAPQTVTVSFEMASRRGEPFYQLIQWAKDYRAYCKGAPPILPNPVQRICTNELKLKTMDRWMVKRGYPDYTAVLGIRADEARRAAKARNQFADLAYPLYQAGVTKQDVLAFWQAQPFDLQLDPQSDEGNCTLCFMKAREKVVKIMRKTHEHDWFWLEAEAMTGATFRKDRNYTQLRAEIDAGTCRLGPLDLVGGDCFCGEGD